jgi:ribonuclease D
MKGISPRVQRESAPLLEAVARASALPDDELPRLPPTPRPPVVSEATRRRIDALRSWRATEGKRLALDVSVVLPQRLLERVAELGPRTGGDLERVEGLRRWRRQAFGDALVRAATP